MKKIYSNLFIFLLFVPQIISWEHVFGHEHEACEHQTVHLHQLDDECSICFITRNASDLNIDVSLELTYLSSTSSNEYIKYNIYLDNSPFTVNSLRAPPVV